MPLFGRGGKRPPIAPTGLPFDLSAAMNEVGMGTRPGLGLAIDGKSYWVIHAICHELGEPQYLEGEGSASAKQVELILSQMAERHGTKPTRQNQLGFKGDKWGGFWVVQRRGQTWVEVLVVTHPKAIGAVGRVQDLRQRLGLSD